MGASRPPALLYRIYFKGSSTMGTMMLRNSERQAFKTCRHRWQWTYRDGRQSREAPHALRFGDLVHQALAPYYKPGRKRGPHPARTFERLYHAQAKALGDQGFNVFSDDKWEKALDLGVSMLEGYVRRFTEEDKEYEVIASEQTFQLRVRHPNGYTFRIVGTFDGVWRHLGTGLIKFKEFKTAAAIKFDGLPMDEQASTYWTYGPKYLRQQKILKPGEMPAEILYTFLRKARPNPDKKLDEFGRVLNLDGSISKNQPAPYFARTPVYRDEPDRRRQHERILQEVDSIRRARQPDADLRSNIKNPGPLHMPNCMGCAVREACELHEAGGDHQSMLNASMISWDPYAAHELPERH